MESNHSLLLSYNMRLLFLDVDGVLVRSGARHLDLGSLAELSRVLKVTGSLIVLHSVWKCDYNSLSLSLTIFILDIFHDPWNTFFFSLPLWPLRCLTSAIAPSSFSILCGSAITFTS